MRRTGLLLATATILTGAAACATQAPEVAAQTLAAAADGDTPPDRPNLVVCAAVLGTMSNAMLEGRASGDRAAVLQGYAAYGRKAAEAMGGESSRQAIGSSYAFYDSLTPGQLAAAADMCLKAVDRDFAEDDWW